MKGTNNSLIKQFSIIGIGTIVTLLLGMVNTPIITRIVSADQYGKFSLIQTYGDLAMSILYLGLDQGFIRYFYERDETIYKSALLRTTMAIPIVTITIFSLITFILKSTNNLFVDFNISTLILFIIYIYTFMIKRFSDLVVRLQFHSKLFSSLSILNKVSYLAIGIPLVLYFPIADSNALILATILAGAIAILLAIFMEKDIWNFREAKNVVINRDKLIRYSFPFLFSMSITSVFQASDKLFVAHYGDNSEVGIFSSAASIVAIISLVQSTFNTVWAPAAIEHYSKFPEDREYHRRGNQIITVVMFTMGMTVILLKDVLALFVGPDFRNAMYILPGLIFGPILYTISETTVSGIVFKEKSKMHIFIALGSLVVDVIANAILVPKFGAIGAGLSTGLSYIVFFSLRTFISLHYYYVNFNLIRLYILTGISFAFAIYNSFNPFNTVILIWYLVILAVICIFYYSTIVNLFKFGINFITNKK